MQMTKRIAATYQMAKQRSEYHGSARWPLQKKCALEFPEMSLDLGQKCAATLQTFLAPEHLLELCADPASQGLHRDLTCGGRRDGISGMVGQHASIMERVYLGRTAIPKWGQIPQAE